MKYEIRSMIIGGKEYWYVRDIDGNIISKITLLPDNSGDSFFIDRCECEKLLEKLNTAETGIEVPEFIRNIDWCLLNMQKGALLNLIAWNKLPIINNDLEGIVSLISGIQNYAVDIAKIATENEVFGA
jgi:hypothetical protein